MINHKMYRLDVSLCGLIFLLFGLCLGTSLANTLIDANTASEDQLQSIAGIGPATAQKKLFRHDKKSPLKIYAIFQSEFLALAPNVCSNIATLGWLLNERQP